MDTFMYIEPCTKERECRSGRLTVFYLREFTKLGVPLLKSQDKLALMLSTVVTLMVSNGIIVRAFCPSDP